jgi:hypothetical protein
MTKFEKCVVVWLMFFGIATFPLIMAIHYAGDRFSSGAHDAFLIFLFILFAAAAIFTFVTCARKDEAKSQENQ